MDYDELDKDQLLEWRRKRHSYFTDIVKDYTSFEEFIRDWDDKLFLTGIQLTQGDGFLRLYIQFNYYAYEEYHVIIGENGHLKLSNGVGFEEICANMIKDISNDEYLDEYPEDKQEHNQDREDD